MNIQEGDGVKKRSLPPKERDLTCMVSVVQAGEYRTPSA